MTCEMVVAFSTIAVSPAQSGILVRCPARHANARLTHIGKGCFRRRRRLECGRRTQCVQWRRPWSARIVVRAATGTDKLQVPGKEPAHSGPTRQKPKRGCRPSGVHEHPAPMPTPIVPRNGLPADVYRS